MTTAKRRQTGTATGGYVNGNVMAAFFVCAIFAGMVLVSAHPVARLQHGAEAVGTATVTAYRQAMTTAMNTETAESMQVAQAAIASEK